MMRWVLWTLAGLLLGLGAHLVSIILMPRMSSRSGFERAATFAPLGRFTIPTAAEMPLPLPDPAIVTALCRYDLGLGPAIIHVPITRGFLSVSLYTPASLNFYALTDRSSTGEAIDLTLFTATQLAETRARHGPDTPGDLRVQAPQSGGMIIVRALVTEPGALDDVRSRLATAHCASGRY